MNLEFHYKKFALYLAISWTIIFGPGTYLWYYFDPYAGTELSFLPYWAWIVPLPFLLFIAWFLSRKLKMVLTKDHIKFSYPHTKFGKEKLPYEEIEDVVVKEKKGKQYISLVRDGRYNDYKTSFFIGFKNSVEFKKALFNILKKKGIDVEVIRV